MKYDLILVGGGLSAGLIAWHLRRSKSTLRFLLIEENATLGGNHTWSFHPTDVSLHENHWIRGLISKTWNSHEVRFPEYSRVFENSGYCAIRSFDFHEKLMAEIGDSVRLSSPVRAIRPDGVVLLSGESIGGQAVLDCRGIYQSDGQDGYQKFVGLSIRTQKPHGVRHPILMDATVEQLEGYRFVYTLPWDDENLLVEDTYYSTGPELESKVIRERVLAYCYHQGWDVSEIIYEERGVLPIPTRMGVTICNDVACVGMAGKFFHPTTGFSLPDAVRVAEDIGRCSALQIPQTIHRLALTHRSHSRFFLRLNRMMFWGAGDADRYRIFQRFYLLPERIILHFYRGRLSWRERFRILAGKSPIPILTLARNMWQRGTP